MKRDRDREREREKEEERERASFPKTQFKSSRVKGFVSKPYPFSFIYMHADRQVLLAPSIPFYSGERQYIKEKKRVCENKRII